MGKLSTLAENLIGSEIVKLGNEINDRKRKGEHIYNFTIGDFDPNIFPIPQLLENLIIESYQKHYTNYPPADGVAELKTAVLNFLKKREDLDYKDDEILIASGGRPLIYTIFKTVVNPGDKVIYAVPSWNNNHYTSMNHAEHCVIEASPENDFMPTAEEIAPHISGASLLCLCTPQNPTGTTLNKTALEKICALVIDENNKRGDTEKKLYLMFDQMYWMLTFGNTVHFNPIQLNPEMKKYTIFVDGISKVFAATGVRVGWAIGPQKVIAKMKALLSHIGAWAPMAEQKAVAAYLIQDSAIDTWLSEYKIAVHKRLENIYKGLITLKEKGYMVDAIAPQAAIYLTVKFNLVGKKEGNNILATQEDVTSYLLGDAKLAVVPFYAFGAERNSPWYRLSVGTSKIEEIDSVMAQLENSLAKLQ